ncbi:MAG: hypothetical protein ACXWZM_11280 [Solirubrobacterales bacterium]
MPLYLSDLQFSPLGAEIVMSLACLAVVVFVVVVMVKRGIDMTCPGCSKRVGRGILDCPRCGFDFRTSGADPS